jgi:hypothetical protein
LKTTNFLEKMLSPFLGTEEKAKKETSMNQVALILILFILVSCLAYSSMLKMKVICFCFHVYLGMVLSGENSFIKRSTKTAILWNVMRCSQIEVDMSQRNILSALRAKQ